MSDCEPCGGTGERIHPADDWRHPHDPNIRLLTCPDCRGTGQATDESDH